MLSYLYVVGLHQNKIIKVHAVTAGKIATKRSRASAN
jgi:hypothetical protein